MMQAQVERETGLILAIGEFPAGSPDETIDIIELDAEAIAAISELGTKTIDADGVVTVTPPPPEPEPGPSRDARLLAAVDLAKEIVGSGGFSETQAAKLAAIFDGLGQAITGDGA